MPLPKTVANPDFGKYLRRRREQLGLTQEQMAQKITDLGYQVSAPTLSRWEETGAVPAMRERQYMSILAAGYNVTVTRIHVAHDPTYNINVGDDTRGIDRELLDMLDGASEQEIGLIKILVRAILYKTPDEDAPTGDHTYRNLFEKPDE